MTRPPGGLAFTGQTTDLALLAGLIVGLLTLGSGALWWSYSVRRRSS